MDLDEAQQAETMPSEQDGQIVDARGAAEQAGLVYVTDDTPGYKRQRAGKGFTYRDTKGRKITDPAVIARIRKLAIPPAYEQVWIAPSAKAHIQATGRDARGRKQYRYHATFREVRDSTKYEHVTAFAAVLPDIRATVRRHMARPGLSRQKVLATVVSLLESTLIRVGNEDYAKANKSFGLTTLQAKHVDVEGATLHFEFKGKSGKIWRLDMRNKRVARIVQACHDLPGQHLFQYVDGEGARHNVGSSDVNAYLREITGRDITAKDFRTWAGTVLAALALSAFGEIDGEAAAKKNIRTAIEQVAARLGNTPTICRKCYVHPQVLDAYLSGEMLLEVKRDIETELRDNLPGLRPEEAAVLALLEARIKRALEKERSGSAARPRKPIATRGRIG